ncbi:MAG: hypothetical protein ACHQU8_06000 [Gemmatimonadales bacterium]
MSTDDSKGRTRFIEYQGHRILLLDFSGIRDPAVALVAIAEARAFVATQPLGSLLTITYIKGSAFMPSIVGALQDLAKHDAPYVKAAVVAGMSGVQRVAFTAIKLVSGRSFKVCRDIEEAKRWLVAENADQPG